MHAVKETYQQSNPTALQITMFLYTHRDWFLLLFYNFLRNNLRWGGGGGRLNVLHPVHLSVVVPCTHSNS